MARRRAPTSRARKKGTEEARGINFLDDVFSREGVLTPKKQTRGNL